MPWWLWFMKHFKKFFTGKEKSNWFFFTTFYISHNSYIKIFLKWSVKKWLIWFKIQVKRMKRGRERHIKQEKKKKPLTKEIKNDFWYYRFLKKIHVNDLIHNFWIKDFFLVPFDEFFVLFCFFFFFLIIGEKGAFK